MLTGIDHIVIVVKDLDHAIGAYRRLGFNVVPGGTHSGGASHNALVGFQDGAYFELFGFLDTQNARNSRWLRCYELGGGLADFCAVTDDLQGDVKRLQAAGLPYKDAWPLGRNRPDGQRVDWELSTTEFEPGPFLPFLIRDFTPRDLRVPSGPEAVHPNGVTGVDEIVIAVRDLNAAVQTYKTLLQSEPIAKSSVDEGSGVSFKLGKATLTLETADEGPIAAQLAGYGQGPEHVYLSASGSGESGTLPMLETHGALLTIRR